MDEITYYNIPSDAGNPYDITYRKIGVTASGRGIWDYNPHGIDKWIPVRNPDVIKNLDSKLHPRTKSKYEREAEMSKTEEPNEMEELDKTGYVFLDHFNNPYKCAMWEDQAWLFYWHTDGHWVSLRRVDQMDIWTFPRNLSDEQQQYYHDRHDAWVKEHTLSLLK